MELKVEKLTKRFQDVTAVNGIDCVLNGGVYGLLGVNGAGKTTFMRMLCALIEPTSGSITWNGKDIFTMDSKYRALLGYLPQDFGYYPDFTVKDYLLYIATIKGLRPTTARSRTKELLAQVGMTEHQGKKMKKLSGGMKRRVGIAQAMLNNPRILILDEPTAGLDPSERIRFRNLISELAGERIVLLSTHIVSDISYIANQIFLMENGQIVLSGTERQIIDSVQERVWTCVVPGSEIEKYMSRYRVSNIKTTAEGAMLRILSNEPPVKGAIPEEPTLEDVFLHYFGGKADTNHVS